jgi:hypothetical protein
MPHPLQQPDRQRSEERIADSLGAAAQPSLHARERIWH